MGLLKTCNLLESLYKAAMGYKDRRVTPSAGTRKSEKTQKTPITKFIALL